jgi:hypothetical protein
MPDIGAYSCSVTSATGKGEDDCLETNINCPITLASATSLSRERELVTGNEVPRLSKSCFRRAQAWGLKSY